MSCVMVAVGVAGCVMPPPRDAPPRPRHPPAYTVAAQMARLQRLGRAHSHEGVTGGYYHTDPEEDGKSTVHTLTWSENLKGKTLLGRLC